VKIGIDLFRAVVEHENKFWKRLVVVFGLVAILWIVFILQEYFGYDFSAYGNQPQTKSGLKGILFSPFIHGSWEHLLSNTLPIMILLTVLLNAYPRVALVVLFFIHITSGLLVWNFAPPTGIHIGISGIIYGVATFLLAAGIFRQDRTSLLIATFIAILYGGMATGFVPTRGVSWQSHLFGAVCGLVAAYIVRKVDLPPSEPNEEDERYFNTLHTSENKPIEPAE
jgi:membrane associated rhomboid family serine protease